MFATVGLIALLIFVFVRPHELVPEAARVPVLYLCFLGAAVGWIIDLRLRLNRLRPSPLLVPALLYAAWSVVTLAMAARHALVLETSRTAMSLLLLLAISQGVPSFRVLRTLAVTMLCITALFVVVAVHQSAAPLGCVRENPMLGGDSLPDGRACLQREDCADSPHGYGNSMRCERLGLLGTTSVELRVRYRGILQDPNELAIALIGTVPFAIALYEARRSLPRLLLAVLSLGAVGLCTVLTKSRSGQLAFVAMIGLYFLRRFRWLGLVAGGVLAVPVLLLGGRDDDAAEESTTSRAEYWMSGFDMFFGSPLYGAGKGQFVEHANMTAHNSFMLVLAEQGIVGLFIWTSLVYMAFKTTMVVYEAAAAPEAAIARLWATALQSSLGAFVVSGLFLSLADHNVLWVYLGLAGALAGATFTHVPGLRVRYGIKDAAFVFLVDVTVISLLFVYVRFMAFA